jgi:hypothetical protein
MANHLLPESEYKTYLFTYRYDGAEWGITLMARTADEAKARLARLSYATYDGEVMTMIPVPSVFQQIGGIIKRSLTSLKSVFIQ